MMGSCEKEIAMHSLGRTNSTKNVKQQQRARQASSSSTDERGPARPIRVNAKQPTCCAGTARQRLCDERKREESVGFACNVDRAKAREADGCEIGASDRIALAKSVADGCNNTLASDGESRRRASEQKSDWKRPSAANEFTDGECHGECARAAAETREAANPTEKERMRAFARHAADRRSVRVVRG